MPARPRSKKAFPQEAARLLLAWYDVHRRTLPWRARPGERAEPYRVWLSEIMLQQTTVAAVAGYYREFLGRWPNVGALAGAPLDEVLAAWAGLGYYARARNLHRAAKMVVDELGGRFPQTAEGLRKLPGVGPYTAGAIAAIAFDERQAAVDANAERVLARIFAVDEPMPKAKVKLRELGQSLVPEKRAGDFAQALMDLGSAICTPKRPACSACPWSKDCEARKRGIQELLPVKGAKAVRPLKRGAAFVARDAQGAVLLEKRPEKGLLGGMLQPPLGPWTQEFPSAKEALLQAPFRAAWKKRAGIVRHGFTHFELEIEVYVAEVSGRSKTKTDCHSRPSDRLGARGGESRPPRIVGVARPGSPSLAPRKSARSSPGMTASLWVAEDKLGDAALPTVMRKIVAHGLDEGGPLFAQARSARKR
jgi:A/G-specific adenine glycosylase